MENIDDFVIDEETIIKVGLQRSSQQINASGSEDARVFEYPLLSNVFIMESLRNATTHEIESIVQKNDEG
jgi:hypothetical protein